MTSSMMMDWINNAHSGFVLAAYGVAAVALVALGLATWREKNRLAKIWRGLARDRVARDVDPAP